MFPRPHFVRSETDPVVLLCDATTGRSGQTNSGSMPRRCGGIWQRLRSIRWEGKGCDENNLAVGRPWLTLWVRSNVVMDVRQLGAENKGNTAGGLGCQF